MKRENLSIEQQDIADFIFKELCGCTVREAKEILKYVASELEEKAVVEQPLTGGGK